jgi:competence protein ComGF
VYCYLAGSGLKIIAEDVTNKGRIDLSIVFDDKVYILEFKVAKKEDISAIEQIKKKKYYEKYQNHKSQILIPKIYLVGIVFNEEEKNIIKFEWEKLKISS